MLVLEEVGDIEDRECATAHDLLRGQSGGSTAFARYCTYYEWPTVNDNHWKEFYWEYVRARNGRVRSSQCLK